MTQNKLFSTVGKIFCPHSAFALFAHLSKLSSCTQSLSHWKLCLSFGKLEVLCVHVRVCVCVCARARLKKLLFEKKLLSENLLECVCKHKFMWAVNGV